jgi:predicted dithiol-disulfide oxidoreductase (DUF899 family)
LFAHFARCGETATQLAVGQFASSSRGLDLLIGAYNLLDFVPKGRDEDSEMPMKWVCLHDRYGQPADALATH